MILAAPAARREDAGEERPPSARQIERMGALLGRRRGATLQHWDPRRQAGGAPVPAAGHPLMGAARAPPTVLARNAAEDIDAPRPARREMRILDHAQTAALLKAAERSPIYIPVLLAATTGMRRGEIVALRWRDLNLDAHALSVSQTVEETRRAPLLFKAPKTERSRRTITLPLLTAEALRSHRARQAAARLRAGPAWVDRDLVCSNAVGEPIKPDAITYAFSKLAATLGLKVRFHDLRHTHISHLLAAGVRPKVASERAGHASVSITLDTYSHVMPGLHEDAANRIDAALRKHLEA